MTQTDAQRIVRAQGMCGELMNDGRDICILSPGHGNHTSTTDDQAIHAIVTHHLRETAYRHLRSVKNDSTDALEEALIRYCEGVRESAIYAVARLHWPSPDRDPACDCYDGLTECPTIKALRLLGHRDK